MSEQPYGDDRGRRLYWLNDNIFVYAALNANGNQPDRVLADKIRKQIINYTEMLHLLTYKDGFPKLGIHEAVVGYQIALPMPCFSSHILDMGSYRLGFVIANGTRERECVVEDFSGFADLILYESLGALVSGNVTEALNRFHDVVNMWDGYGIADASYRNPIDAQYLRYVTYKLALLLIVAGKLNQTGSLPFHNQIVDTIWKMQAYNGGIITNYLGSAIPHGVANTETTALVVLANPLPINQTTSTTTSTSIAPPWLVTISMSLEVLIALVGALVILNVIVVVSLIRRRPR